MPFFNHKYYLGLGGAGGAPVFFLLLPKQDVEQFLFTINF